MVKTKEEKAAYNKIYYDKNKKKINEQHKILYSKKRDNMTCEQKNINTEERRTYMQTPERIKMRIITDWKMQRIISDDFDKTCEEFLNTTHCETCFIRLTFGEGRNSRSKCLDHDHSISNSHNIRNVLCRACNVNDNSKNTSGNTNIYWLKSNKRWIYKRTWHGIKYFRSFNFFVQACIYKKQIEDKYIENNKQIMIKELLEERNKME